MTNRDCNGTLRQRILAGTSALALLLAAAPAWADGGKGGATRGGSGGTDSTTGVGGSGGSASGINSALFGGGGGGAGETGGAGGNGGAGAGAGGTGGATAGASGTVGGAGYSNGSGGGGGGGAHGFVDTGSTLPMTAVSGGMGGTGGGNPGGAFTGGGGGAGGYGAVLGAATGTFSVNVIGGAGGAGGTGFAGGSGGSGGTGLYILNGGSFTIDSAIQGGNGGAGGAGIGPLSGGGADGTGGAGIVGTGLYLTLGSTASVTGGTAGGGGSRADAITFTGGANALTLNTGASLTGNIGVTGSLEFNQPTNFTLSNVITGTGSLSKTGAGTLTLSAANSYAGGATVSGGTLMQGAAGAFVGNSAYTVNGGTLDLNNYALTASSLSGTGGTVALGSAALTVNQATDTSFAGAITGTGSLSKSGAGVLTLSGVNSYSGGTTVNAGILRQGAGLAFNGGAYTVNGGTLDLNNFAVVVSSLSGTGGTVALGSAVLNVLQATNTSFAGAITGTGPLYKSGAGTLVLSGANSYSGMTVVTGGTLRQGVAGAFVGNGAYRVNSGTLDLNNFALTASSLSALGGTIALGSAALTVDQATNTNVAGAITGAGSLSKTGAGMLTLSGTNTYIGPTTVSGGTLSVNGSIAGSAVTVAAGGMLGGNGTVGPTTISGGTLAPGNSIGTLAIAGNLAFTAGSAYAVEVSPSNADRVNVGGTATLGGASVAASFAPGAYVAKQYTILNATGGVSGTFGSKVDTNLPAGFKSGLSYDPNNAYLDLTLDYTPPTSTPTLFPNSGLNPNQSGVANALTGYFNSHGGIPMVFGSLTPAGLSQAAGEPATGVQTVSRDAMNLFMGTMVDLSPDGRGMPLAPGPDGFAGYSSASGKAMDLPTRKLPLTADPDAWRWSVWGSGFGAARFTGADGAAGTAAVTDRVYGAAVGADYRLTPSTVAGFALGGGGTNFNTYGLGSGSSDLFQAGAFIRQHFGQSYVSAALAYGWQDVTTDRSVAGLDRLQGRFNVNSWAGRIDAGHRFALGSFGLTPYGALQLTRVSLPSYVETALGGPGLFALSYADKDATSTRSELGLRADARLDLGGLPLTLRGGLAWVHNFNPGSSVVAGFLSLPGTGFLVQGAAQDRNALRTTATAELSLRNGLSLVASFDGEFSRNSRSLGGKAAIRYSW